MYPLRPGLERGFQVSLSLPSDPKVDLFKINVTTTCKNLAIPEENANEVRNFAHCFANQIVSFKQTGVLPNMVWLRNTKAVVSKTLKELPFPPSGYFLLTGGDFKCHQFEEWWVAFCSWVCHFVFILDSISRHQILRLYLGKNKAIYKKPFQCLSVFLLQPQTQTCHFECRDG